MVTSKHPSPHRVQLLKCQGDLIGSVFVNRQFDNEVSNRVQVLGSGGTNRAAAWL